MAPKRKVDDADTSATRASSSGAQRKKQKRDAAREIKVQFSSGTDAHKIKSRLPTTIDVEKFTEARAFEINAMQDAMESAKGASNSRVWQSLPRHLRRRAASHDVRRVPARLREKAKAEMDPPKVALKKQKPQRGKAKRMGKTQDFLKRQQKKTWLETHIWHAKRMHMYETWGYVLAETPTEKSYRASHRASLHASILHDASYEAIIEVKGLEWMLKESLDRIADAQAPGPSSKRYLSGARVCATHVYKPKAYPLQYIGPVDFIWQARESALPSAQVTGVSAKGKGKGTNDNDSDIRRVWIRCHPLIYDDVLAAVHDVVKAPLYKVPDEVKVTIEVADLRDRFNIFELVGPKSSQVIHGALQPVKTTRRPAFDQFWNALGQLQSAGSTPRGLIAGFDVMDPRLAYPPKNTKIRLRKGSEDKDLVGLWPTSELALSKLWDEDHRGKLAVPRYKKKDIDERKSKHLVPGTPLRPLRQDDRIPALLIQRSIETQKEGSHPCANSSRPLHGWTLFLPRGWGMPFFSSLTHTGTRVGGTTEVEMQQFNAGCPGFPHDYPSCPAYESHTSHYADIDEILWSIKPPAKRTNYEKLGTRNPWKPDWNHVLGLDGKTNRTEKLVSTQRSTDHAGAEEPQTTQATEVAPWLFRGQKIVEVIDALVQSTSTSADLLLRVNEWRSKRDFKPLTCSGDALLKSALVMVRLNIPRSGSPNMHAMIYSMSDEEALQCHAMVDHEDEEFNETDLGNTKCKPEDTVGFVTSGKYCLSLGRGTALGSVSLSRYLELRKQLFRLGKTEKLPLVKVRNNDSTICRAAYIELAN